MSREIALECVRLAIPLVSPTVEDRWEGVAELSSRMYSHIKNLAEGLQEDEAEKPRRMRKPRETAVQTDPS